MGIAAFAVLACAGIALADDLQNLGRFQPNTNPAAEKPAAKENSDDTELVRFRRYAYYGGAAYYGSYNYYSPGYAFSYYPSYYAANYYVAPGPIFGIPRLYYAPSYYHWGYCAGDSAPAISLEMKRNAAREPASNMPSPFMPKADAPRTPSTIPPANTFPYDGGPSAPVPMPMPDAPSSAPVPQTVPSDSNSLKVSFPSSTKKPFTYPAYGQKK